MLAETGKNRRVISIELAKALSAIHSPSSLHDNLEKLLFDNELEVRIEAIKSAKKSSHLMLFPGLIFNLQDKITASLARKALVSFGEGIVDSLSIKLEDENEEISLRGAVARVLGRIPHVKSVDALLQNLNHDSPNLRYNIIKGLNKLRSRHTLLEIKPKVLEQTLFDEAKYYFELFAIIVESKKSNEININSDLLVQTLDGRIEQSLERIFRILALLYDPADIYRVYHAATQGDKLLRSNAYELLDNILDGEIKNIILSIIDNVTDQEKLANGNKYFNLKKRSLSEHVKVLYDDSDSWLKVAALYTIGSHKMNELKLIAEDALLSDDPLIKETAEYSLKLLKAA